MVDARGCGHVHRELICDTRHAHVPAAISSRRAFPPRHTNSTLKGDPPANAHAQQQVGSVLDGRGGPHTDRVRRHHVRDTVEVVRGTRLRDGYHGLPAGGNHQKLEWLFTPRLESMLRSTCNILLRPNLCRLEPRKTSHFSCILQHQFLHLVETVPGLIRFREEGSIYVRGGRICQPTGQLTSKHYACSEAGQSPIQPRGLQAHTLTTRLLRSLSQTLAIINLNHTQAVRSLWRLGLIPSRARRSKSLTTPTMELFWSTTGSPVIRWLTSSSSAEDMTQERGETRAR